MKPEITPQKQEITPDKIKPKIARDMASKTRQEIQKNVNIPNHSSTNVAD